MPFPLSFALELVGMFTIWLAIPGLRAGVADAVPAHLRGAGFGAFNIVSVIFGAAAAPFVVGQLSQLTNLRAALLIVTPPVYLGAYALFRARDHLDADAAKIFEAVMLAIQAEQAEAEADAAAAAATPEVEPTGGSTDDTGPPPATDGQPGTACERVSPGRTDSRSTTTGPSARTSSARFGRRVTFGMSITTRPVAGTSARASTWSPSGPGSTTRTR